MKLARADQRLYSTAGIHPTRCSEFKEEEADAVIAELIEVAKKGKEEKKIVAIGEFGLDYDRLHFCDKEVIAVEDVNHSDKTSTFGDNSSLSGLWTYLCSFTCVLVTLTSFRCLRNKIPIILCVAAFIRILEAKKLQKN